MLTHSKFLKVVGCLLLPTEGQLIEAAAKNKNFRYWQTTNVAHDRLMATGCLVYNGYSVSFVRTKGANKYLWHTVRKHVYVC